MLELLKIKKIQRARAAQDSSTVTVLELVKIKKIQSACVAQDSSTTQVLALPNKGLSTATLRALLSIQAQPQ